MISVANEPAANKTIELLRVCTAGSVDDGKSTLIGRLLYDCHAIPEDQYEAVRAASGIGDEGINLALLTDGLRAEREQQITIDVAYRYFSSPNRRFILADTPGHQQYTRNMVTGASTAELAIVLVDARKGLLSQSKRHAIISSLLRVPQVLLAVNKMDLVDYDEAIFRDIESKFMEFASNYSSQAIRVIPISALDGDNIVTPSANMPWYEGPTLLEHMEAVPIQLPDKGAFRFPVQSVIRPNQDFRGYAGQIISGLVSVGEEVIVFPSLLTSKVKSIVTAEGELQTARAGDAVVITLEDEIDISRGNMIAGIVDEPALSSEFEVDLCWLGDHPHRPGKHYVLMHGTDYSGAVLEDDIKLVDIETLETEPTTTLKRNDIAKAVITSFKPLPLDLYKKNRTMGAMLLIDPDTNVPAAATMVTRLIATSENLSALAI